MSKLCEGRVAIVTGGARGVGRDYSLMLARHGAKVVVNDIGGDEAGRGADVTPAQQVVDEIRAAGGEAVVNGGDVSNWKSAQEMVQQALDTYGRLDVLINNAGILRDKMFVNMSEADWDDVVRVHLKGTAAPSHHAVVHWRANKKAGNTNDARIINTTSHSGLFGSLVGQTNYENEPTGTTPTKHLAHRTSKWMVEETPQKYEESDTEHRYCQRIHSAVSTRILQVTAVGVSVKLAKPNVVRWTDQRHSKRD